MSTNNKFQIFKDIIDEMTYVYKHDNRPWLIGFSGGKDSSMLVSLVIDMVMRLPEMSVQKKSLLLLQIRELRILSLKNICISRLLRLMNFPKDVTRT